MPEISALGRQREKNHTSKASLGYIASSGHPVVHNETVSQSKLPWDTVIVLLGVLAKETTPAYQ